MLHTQIHLPSVLNWGRNWFIYKLSSVNSKTHRIPISYTKNIVTSIYLLQANDYFPHATQIGLLRRKSSTVNYQTHALFYRLQIHSYSVIYPTFLPFNYHSQRLKYFWQLRKCNMGNSVKHFLFILYIGAHVRAYEWIYVCHCSV